MNDILFYLIICFTFLSLVAALCLLVMEFRHNRRNKEHLAQCRYLLRSMPSSDYVNQVFLHLEELDL